MKQHYTDERTGIRYTLQGDYYLPDLALLAEDKQENIGVWGMRHKRFLKENHRVLYTNLMTSGKLTAYAISQTISNPETGLCAFG